MTIQSGSGRIHGSQPTSSTTPSATARTGVPRSLPMSIPVWKWAQLPRRGSAQKPVHPNGWVTFPLVGQIHVEVPSTATVVPAAGSVATMASRTARNDRGIRDGTARNPKSSSRERRNQGREYEHGTERDGGL